MDVADKDIAYWMSELTRLLYPSNNIVTDMATTIPDTLGGEVWKLPEDYLAFRRHYGRGNILLSNTQKIRLYDFSERGGAVIEEEMRFLSQINETESSLNIFGFSGVRNYYPKPNGLLLLCEVSEMRLSLFWTVNPPNSAKWPLTLTTATLELVWGLPFIDMTIGFVEFLVRALRCELDFDLFGEPITGKFVSPADPEFKEFLPTW